MHLATDPGGGEEGYISPKWYHQNHHPEPFLSPATGSPKISPNACKNPPYLTPPASAHGLPPLQGRNPDQRAATALQGFNRIALERPGEEQQTTPIPPTKRRSCLGGPSCFCARDLSSVLSSLLLGEASGCRRRGVLRLLGYSIEQLHWARRVWLGCLQNAASALTLSSSSAAA